MQIPITPLIAYFLVLAVATLHQVAAAPVILSKRCPPGTQPVPTQPQAYPPPAPNPFGLPDFSCVAIPALPATPEVPPLAMPIPSAPTAPALPSLPTLPTLPDLSSFTTAFTLPALPNLPGFADD